MNKYLKYICIVIPCFVFSAEKILIITHSHSRPDFIEIQNRTFKAFLQDDYEFIVFNDASNHSLSSKIEQICKKLNIECIRVPQEMHTSTEGADRHSDGIQLSLNMRGYDHNGIVVLIDSDMFLIKPLSIRKYMQNCDLLGALQERSNGKISVTYLWPGLLFMNMNTLPNKRTINLRCGKVDDVFVDTGGHLHLYFKSNSSIKIKDYQSIHPDQITGNHDEITTDFMATLQKNLDNRIYFMEFYLDYHFLHYYAGGSNWPSYSEKFLQEKNQFFNNYINLIIEQEKNKQLIDL